ncbi:DUF4255 domain-containing protein [Streptomyces canus]|uniref:DUF4255 domain-containing protein n=1 Tax=Streptomyces canus TaxID=58343 RepID=UPI00368DDF22
MADFAAINDVSTSLVRRLTEALAALGSATVPAPVAQLHDLSTPVSGATPVLAVFLYEVSEDTVSRNRGPRLTDPPDPTVVKPPMALLLRYLLTPWSTDPSTQHLMMARVVQALYDDLILEGPQLQGRLSGGREALKLTLAPLNLEERTRIWWAIQQPYRLSLNYEVRGLRLDAVTTDEWSPVTLGRFELADAAPNRNVP